MSRDYAYQDLAGADLSRANLDAANFTGGTCAVSPTYQQSAETMDLCAPI